MAEYDNDSADDVPQGDSDDDILAQARLHYRLCVENDTINRNEAILDLTFKLGGDNQWDALAVAQRRNDGRPVITVNQLPTFLHQVTNDLKMNTPAVKTHPVGYGADDESAKVRQGMIRHIEYDSNADVCYDIAGASAADIGWGYWWLDTQYESPTSFDQKIMFQDVPNTLAVRIDPLSTKIDGSDMQYAFIESLMNKQDFKREYPKANANSPDLFTDDAYAQWIKEDTVLVCLYFCIKNKKATVIELSNGETGYKDDLLELPPGVKIAREREGERPEVWKYKITGVDVLEKTQVKMVGGAWIPVFPVYGDRTFIEGRMYLNGIIRNAKGPCQSFNVMISGATEEVALRAKAPYIGVEGSFEGHEDEWNQANNRAFPYLEYTGVTVDGQLAPPPARQPMADIPAGMLAMTMHARDNIKSVTGLYDSSLGAQGNATSGKQEVAQQRQGDISNFHFADNRNKSVLHCGRVINAMIPAYYDAERMVRIMREDDTVEAAVINKRLPGSLEGIEEVENDMTGGEFSVTVSAGPSYSTMRQESQEFFTSAMSAAKDPVTNAIVTYLAMRSSDAPGSDIATKMIATTLPPAAQQILDEEKKDEQEQVINTPRGPLPVSQVPQVLAQLEQQLAAAGEAVEKSQADKQAAEVLKQQNDQERVAIDRMNAETARFKAMEEADKAESELLLAYQQQQIDARQAEMEVIQGDTTAFEAWKATLEADTRIRVAEIAARSADRRAEFSAQAATSRAAISAQSADRRAEISASKKEPRA